MDSSGSVEDRAGGNPLPAKCPLVAHALMPLPLAFPQEVGDWTNYYGGGQWVNGNTPNTH